MVSTHFQSHWPRYHGSSGLHHYPSHYQLCDLFQSHNPNTVSFQTISMFHIADSTVGLKVEYSKLILFYIDAVAQEDRHLGILDVFDFLSDLLSDHCDSIVKIIRSELANT